MKQYLEIPFTAIFVSIFAVSFAPGPSFAAPTTLPGGTLYYSNQVEFETAYPGLLKEDFEESQVTPGTSVPMPEPLDSTTDVPGAFSPGDILPGLTIRTVEGAHPTNALLALPPNYWGNTSDVVGIMYLADSLDIIFSKSSIYAVGMDLMIHIDTADITISLYGQGNNLLDTLTVSQSVTPTFFGFYAQEPIKHITAESVKCEGVDNIQMNRSFPWPIFLPALGDGQ